jgi:antitoxin PrlF
MHCNACYNELYKENSPMIHSTITERGQTTIPASIRKALNLKSHQRIVYEMRDEGVLIKPETETLMDLAGSLKSMIKPQSKAEEREASRQARLERYK